MASEDLKQLDRDITAAIKKDAGEWRKEFSDIMPTVVSMEVKAVQKQCWEEMARREGYKTIRNFKNSSADTDALGVAINTHVGPFLSAYHAKVTQVSNDKNWNVEWDSKKKSAANFVFTLSSNKTGDVFNKIKDMKRDAQRNLLAAINAWAKLDKGRGSRRGIDTGDADLDKKIGTKTGRKGKAASKEIRKNDSFLDYGHVGASAVGTQRALATADFLKNYKGNDKAAATRILAALANAFEFILKDRKSYKGDMESILEVMLESSRMNKATMDKGEVTAIQSIIDTALDKVAVKKGGKTYWVMREGSDSFFDMVEKSVVAGWAKGLKPNKTTKKLKTSVQYQNRKDSTKTVKGKQTKRKVTAKRGQMYKLPPIVTRKEAQRAAARAPATAPLAMIGLINKELPAVVEANMGRPRLESITGRFAGSARVTDIISTTQGYPSIGYTYQTDPYQTFEVGGKQGSTDYDPRRLIDQSLRQIAMKFAMGRFYTRREE
jgi:hypothetical protein